MQFKKKTDKTNTNTYSYNGGSISDPNSERKKWYQKTGWIILWLILFFPVGLFLMWRYSNWKKAVKIIISGFFVLCIVGYYNAPDLESIAISADTITVYDINEQIEINQKVKPDGYTISSSAFKTTGGKVKESKGTIYFISDEPGTFEIYAESSGAKSNTLTFTIEDKTAIAKAEDAKKKAKEKAEKKAKEEAEKKAKEETEKKAKEEAEKKAKEEAEKKAEEERIAQEKAAAEAAAQQAEQERIAQEQAAEQAAAEQAAQQPATSSYVLNYNTMKFHKSSCRDVSKIAPQNYGTYDGTRDDVINQGFSPCGHCHP